MLREYSFNFLFKYFYILTVYCRDLFPFSMWIQITHQSAWIIFSGDFRAKKKKKGGGSYKFLYLLYFFFPFLKRRSAGWEDIQKLTELFPTTDIQQSGTTESISLSPFLSKNSIKLLKLGICDEYPSHKFSQLNSKRILISGTHLRKVLT